MATRRHHAEDVAESGHVSGRSIDDFLGYRCGVVLSSLIGVQRGDVRFCIGEPLDQVEGVRGHSGHGGSGRG